MKPRLNITNAFKKHLFHIAISGAMFLYFQTDTVLADVVKWTDENGQVHYGDVVPEKYRDIAEPVDVTPANTLETQRYPAFPAAKDNKEKKKKNVQKKAADNTLKNEKKCQKIYGMSCDQINNWEANAKANCLAKNGGKKCNDPKYLETKYKPRTLKEKQLQAARNSNRRKEEAREARKKISR